MEPKKLVSPVERARAFASKLADKGYWISDVLEAELAAEFEQVRIEIKNHILFPGRFDHQRGICDPANCVQCTENFDWEKPDGT